MDSFTIQDLNFVYPEQDRQILKDVNLHIEQGQFITLCGPSGCGKTTLLRHLKSVLAPHGERSGCILFEGQQLEELGQRIQSQQIGFVLQSPENQIVTDKVWHELAFGLESLGYDTQTIRLRVAEMASFFGIQTWFYKSVTELSGGQKQLLNLAAIMAMQPKVLILDEPTSQLDPIAAADFLATVGKINRELGTTIIMTEHRLEEVLPLSDRVVVMDNGQIIADDTPQDVGQLLGKDNHKMFLAMPVPMRIYAAVPNSLQCPITVREGRQWLNQLSTSRPIDQVKKEAEPKDKDNKRRTLNQPVVELEEVWFKYERELPDVVKGVSLKVEKGEFYALLGGNGTGKTTTLSLISGINKAYRGTVRLEGKKLSDIPNNEKFGGILGVMPQNPQSLFVKKTVELDLHEILKGRGVSKEKIKEQVTKVSKICELEYLLQQHPYDLSGGEQQKAALAKVLLLKPRILLLDEPTKGLDSEFKQVFAGILNRLLNQGVTIIMVSHDIEFCAKYAHRCAMFFDGNIVTEGTPAEFFSGNSFYTTAANRMARHLLPEAVTAEDVIAACGGIVPLEPEERNVDFDDDVNNGGNHDSDDRRLKSNNSEINKKEGWKPLKKKSAFSKKIKSPQLDQVAVGNRKLSKRTIAAAFMILLLIPLTIFCGVYYLGDRKYYFISMLLIVETMLPFAMVFESRKPQARELIVIAVLCAIGVAGRAVFFMIPLFKPVVAIVIIAGVAFGGETGFLVGAVTGFVSNMFFGQGPWTPWQMFSFGIIGFIAGVLFRKGLLCRNKVSLAIFGGLTTFFIYGGLMNPAAVIMYQEKPTLEMFTMAYIQGVPFDLIHSTATVFFLWIISQPMLEKLDRIKTKYGLIEG